VGAVSEDVLDIVRSQYDALQFLAAAARQGRDVSVSLIKELHVALTGHQTTYSASGPNGISFQATLHHGEWKTQPNHVTRPDGSRLEDTPPDQVQSQMDQLVELHRSYRNKDAIVQVSWLHHRFVCIHPFEDGNGRVARCLTLLGLLKNDLAPLVVDRRERDRYLRSLDQANEGDLRPLIRFFAELEIVALRSELERPADAIHTLASGGGPLAVLDASISRLRELQVSAGAQDRATGIAALANGVHSRLRNFLEDLVDKFGERLREGIDPDARAWLTNAAPPDEKARYWRRQVVRAARSVDFFANLQDGTWWTGLHIVALGQSLRHLVFLQKVGRGETGVLALTVYAEIASTANDEGTRSEAEPVVISTPTETVTWIHTDSPEARWQNVVEVVDTTLASSLATFTAGLG